jgi:hypothetical protein
MGLKALPYFYFANWRVANSSQTEYLTGIWVDDWSGVDKTSAIEQLVFSYKPDLFLVSGQKTGDLKGILRRGHFRDIAYVDSVEDRSFVLASTRTILPIKFPNLGVMAWSGGVFSILLDQEREFQIGVMNLEPSINKENFERNRVTARRLSSIMRDSSLSRLVAARFNTTPFSQFVSVYTEQAGMNSLMFGERVMPTSNILISRDLGRQGIKRIVDSGGDGDAFWFKIATNH